VTIVVTGSIAYDYLMTFPGSFSDHLLPEHLSRLSVSFLVDTMDKRRGGCAPNIAYTLALLKERPKVMATAGLDFGEYRQWLEAAGVDTSLVKDVPSKFTASCFINTVPHRARLRPRADRPERSGGDGAVRRRVPRLGDPLHLRSRPAVRACDGG
jgi:sugar/nucleoside kinase (ribokinase family)